MKIYLPVLFEECGIVVDKLGRLAELDDEPDKGDERGHDTQGGDDQGAGAHLAAAASLLEPVREHLWVLGERLH